MAAIANQRWISIRNIIIYLETQFRANRWIFVFWSPYGFTSCKYPFPLKSFHFWIFNDFFNFYISGHFENSKTWMHLLRWGSSVLWSLVTIGSSVSENLVGQNRSEKKWKRNNNNNNNNKIWYDLKDHNMAPKQWIINLQHHNLLGNQFCPNRRIFVFWWPFWIQNGCHSKPKWSPYGAACLTPCKHPFPLKSFHFWIFNNLFFDFILAAILKI